MAVTTRRSRMRCRYSVYLLYWYKSTNTDAEGAAAVLRERRSRRKISANLQIAPGGDQHTSAFASIRQLTSAYVSIRSDRYQPIFKVLQVVTKGKPIYICICVCVCIYYVHLYVYMYIIYIYIIIISISIYIYIFIYIYIMYIYIHI